MSNDSAMSHSSSSKTSRWGDPVVLGVSIGFIVVFVAMSLYDIDLVADGISAGFAWTARVLGSFFQLLLLLTFQLN